MEAKSSCNTRIIYVIQLPPRPRLVITIGKLSEAAQQVVERLVLEWEAKEYG